MGTGPRLKGIGWMFLAVGLIALVVLALFLGDYFGIGTRSADEENETLNNITARAEKIAVVNLDEGYVDSGGVKMNYAEELMPASSKLYALMSYSDASRALKRGNVDAVVTLPADFSEKVQGVNYNDPEKIVLDYVIGGELPAERRINVDEDVMSLQMFLNYKLSYTYVYSLYKEVHSAQDQTGQLLRNDEKDNKSAETLSMHEFLRILNLSDMPEIDPGFKDTGSDINTAAQATSGYMNDAISIYQGRYDAAKADYETKAGAFDQEIEAANKNIDEYTKNVEQYDKTSIAWFNAAKEWQTDVAIWHGSGAYATWLAGANKWESDAGAWTADAGSEVAAWESGAAAWTANIQTYAFETGEWITEYANTYYGKLNDYQELLTEYQDLLNGYDGDLQAYYSDLQTYRDDLQSYYSDLQEGTTEEDPPKPPIPPERPQSLIELANKLNDDEDSDVNIEIPEGDSPLIAPELTEPPEIPELTPPEPAIAPAPVAPEISEIPNSVPDELGTVPKLAAPLPLAFAWDPNSYVGETEKGRVNTLLSQYTSALNTVETALDSRDAENMTKLGETFSEYSEYVSTMHSDIQETYEKEHTDVDGVREKLLKDLKSTSNANRKLIEIFSKKLPESRSYGKVNEQLADFVSSPMEVKMSVGAVSDKGEGKAELYKPIPIIAAIALLLSIIASVILYALRRRAAARM
jgi:uncharacterized phage infection (PIP) family protein YhgE